MILNQQVLNIEKKICIIHLKMYKNLGLCNVDIINKDNKSF